MEEFKGGARRTIDSALKRKLLNKTVEELVEVGIADFDIEEKECNLGVSGKLLLDILNVARKDGLAEVNNSIRMIGDRKLYSNQAMVIVKNFEYSSINWKPFLIRIMPNIIDPENIFVLVKEHTSSRSYEDFKMTVESIYPEINFSETREIKKESELVIRRELTPMAKKMIYASWCLMLLNILFMIILWIF